eukprot:544712_1
MFKTTILLLSPIFIFILTASLITYCWLFSFSSNHASVTSKNISYFTSHVLVRSLILRCLGFMYFVVFSTALYQYDGLWSNDGILPISSYMNLLSKQAQKKSQHWFGAFLIDTPTLLWFFDLNKSSIILKTSLYIGLILSIFILIGSSNYFILIALWFIKLSLVNVGQRFMQYGWHPQFLEFAFLCIFLGDSNLNIFNKTQYNPSYLIILLLRWLIFRVMLEPGIGKILGGDNSWWPDCNAMVYHYWTQPSPNIGAYFLHNLSNDILIWFTMSNHVIELILPFFIVFGYFKIFCYIRYLTGLIFIMFQLILVFGGNYSYLSYLTIVQCIIIFDDKFFMDLFYLFCSDNFVNDIENMINETYNSYQINYSYFSIGFMINLMLFIFTMYLSHKPLKTILTGKRAHDYSFNNWHLVNGYAAFSHMTKDRHEIVILGSNDGQTWKEYGFKTKPDKIDKIPLSIAPIDWFLDWSLWFVPLSHYKYHPWFLRLLYKILQGNNDVLALMGHNPFADRPPQLLKVMKYRYIFDYVNNTGNQMKTDSFWDCFNANTNWWKRVDGKELIHVFHLQSNLVTRVVSDDAWLTQ